MNNNVSDLERSYLLEEGNNKSSSFGVHNIEKDLCKDDDDDDDDNNHHDDKPPKDEDGLDTFSRKKTTIRRRCTGVVIVCLLLSAVAVLFLAMTTRSKVEGPEEWELWSNNDKPSSRQSLSPKFWNITLPSTLTSTSTATISEASGTSNDHINRTSNLYESTSTTTHNNIQQDNSLGTVSGPTGTTSDDDTIH